MIEFLVCWTANGVARSDAYETLTEAHNVACEVAADGFEPRVERREFSNGPGRAPHIYTLFAENLDCANHETLITEAYYHRGTLYGRYAELKIVARRFREKGDIVVASAIENDCDDLYNQLPAWQHAWLASHPLVCLRAAQSARRSQPTPTNGINTCPPIKPFSPGTTPLVRRPSKTTTTRAGTPLARRRRISPHCGT